MPEKAPHRSIRETRTFYTNMTTPPQESIRDCYKNRRFSVQAPQIKVRNTRARSDDERSTLSRLQFFPAAAAAAAAARGVSFGLFRNVALQPAAPTAGRKMKEAIFERAAGGVAVSPWRAEGASRNLRRVSSAHLVR